MVIHSSAKLFCTVVLFSRPHLYLGAFRGIHSVEIVWVSYGSDNCGAIAMETHPAVGGYRIAEKWRQMSLREALERVD